MIPHDRSPRNIPGEHLRSLYLGGSRAYAHRFGYSGKAAGAVFAAAEIRDALPVIHGPPGCGFHYRYICRRDYLPAYGALCTNLDELDIVLGGEGRLRDLLIEADRRSSPALIVVIPSAPVDMIHDDMRSAVEAVRPRLRARVVVAASERFSHVDKRAHRAEEGERDYRGCGFVEVMKALVAEVMEPRPLRPGSVNLTGFAWGSGGGARLDGMAHELEGLGVEINAFLPNCRTEEIVAAPRAELNVISRRAGWAREMERRFGTSYVDAQAFADYRRPEGLERLYLAVADRLGARFRLRGQIASRRRAAEEAAASTGEALSGLGFALCPGDVRDAPEMIRRYALDYGLRLRFVCLRPWRQGPFVDSPGDPDRESLLLAAREALDETGCPARLLVDADDRTLARAIGSVDFVIGGEWLGSGFARARVLRGRAGAPPLDFSGFVEESRDLPRRLAAAPCLGSLVAERFRYSEGRRPLLERGGQSPSRRMWEELWLRRAPNPAIATS